MATSTFGKRFSVGQSESSRFVKEMSAQVPPTLQKNFKSNYKNLEANKDLRGTLTTLLGK